MPTINIYRCDCNEFMKSKPDKGYKLAIVDPPYGIGEHGQRMNRTERWKNPGPIKHKRVKWDDEAPSREYFDELKRISSDQIIWGANHFLDNIPFNISSPCWLVWDKKTAGDFADCELAWTSFSTSVRIFEWLWSGFRKQKPEDRIHPTQKPIALYKWILKNYATCKECGGDEEVESLQSIDCNRQICKSCRGKKPKIFDSHGGSMSIGIACIEMGFDLDICELDSDYFEAAIKRINSHVRQLNAFSNPPTINIYR